MGIVVLRIDGDLLLELNRRFVVLALVPINPTQVVVSYRACRVDLNRAFEGGRRRIELIHSQKRQSQKIPVAGKLRRLGGKAASQVRRSPVILALIGLLRIGVKITKP